MNALWIMEWKKATSVVDKIPDRLLLNLGRPLHLLIADRPVHPFAKNDEQLKVFERLGVSMRRRFR